jgi:hypothetical protein
MRHVSHHDDFGPGRGPFRERGTASRERFLPAFGTWGGTVEDPFASRAGERAPAGRG